MQVAVSNQVVTMSSREIADLVGSRHDDVKRSIERLATDKTSADGTQVPAVIQLPPLAEVKNHLGQTVKEYLVGKRDSYVIVAQLSPAFTARLVDRWQELEAQVAAPSLPTLSRMDILKLAIDSEERALAAEAKLIEQAPKADFYDKYTKATGNKGIREVAKLLHANEREFVTFLRTNNVVYRLNGRLMPYSHQQGALRLDVKAGVAENGQAFQQAVFTPKGIAWIAAEWAKYQAVEV